ncbi:tetratricopeptide repeat protein [candidate division KSB1 bacterium]
MLKITNCFIFISFLLIGIIEPGIAQENNALGSAAELFRSNKYVEAEKILSGLVDKDGRNHEAVYYLGRISYDQKNLKTAEKLFKKCTDLNDLNSDYHYLHARVKAEILRDTNKLKLLLSPRAAVNVIKELERSVELDDMNMEAREYLTMLYYNVPGIFGGDKNKAYMQAEEINKRDPRMGGMISAMIDYQEKRYDEAGQKYRELTDTYPGDAAVRYSAGEYYANREDYDTAFDMLDKALEIDPGHMTALYLYGKVSSISGNGTDKAVEFLKRYFELEKMRGISSSDWAHYRLGAVYEHRGEKELAREQYEIALQLNRKFKEAKNALKSLDK